jgi:tetratricopeptide (TPR) repeat protein
LALSFQLISFLTKAQSYSVTQADSLYNTNNFKLAATCYERVYFFSKNKEEKIYSLLARANCFKNLKEHYEAYNSLIRALNYDLNDSIKCAINYELALNLYLSNYYADADKFCAKNYSLPINSTEYKNSILLHGFILNELNNYKLAAEKFQEYNNLISANSELKDSLNNMVANYYIIKNQPKLKSLKKAIKLSKFIPGAGLFYVGEPAKALANIGLQLFALGYIGANIYFTNYITAASVGVFLIKSFYTGGVNQLNDIVPNKNYVKSRKFNDNFKTQYLYTLNKNGIFN